MKRFIISTILLAFIIFTPQDVSAVTWGNSKYAAQSQSASFSTRVTLRQQTDFSSLSAATSTITLQVRISTSTFTGTSTAPGWISISCGDGTVSGTNLVSSYSADGGNSSDGYLYTLTYGTSFYNTYPNCTLNTWTSINFEQYTYDFRVRGSVLNEYISGDAVWLNNFSVPGASDDIIADVYFQLSNDIAIFDLFPPSPIQIGTASSTVDCSQYDDTAFFSSSTIASIGCYIKEAAVDTLNFLIIPDSAGGLTFLNNQFTEFQNTFPFSLFFNFNEIVELAIDSWETDGSTFQFPVVLRVNLASTTIPLLSSSSIVNIVGQESVNLLFEFQKYLAWVFVGYLAIKISSKTFKK